MRTSPPAIGGNIIIDFISRAHIYSGNKCMGIRRLPPSEGNLFGAHTHSPPPPHIKRGRHAESIRPRRQTTNWLPLRELYLKAEQIKISSNQMYRLSLRFIRKWHSLAHDSPKWDGAVVSTLSVLKSTQGMLKDRSDDQMTEYIPFSIHWVDNLLAYAEWDNSWVILRENKIILFF